MIDLEQIANRWSDWALATTWQLTLLVALVWLAALAAKPLPARLRYALWGLVIIKVFLPPSLAASWGVGQWGIRPLCDVVLAASAEGVTSGGSQAVREGRQPAPDGAPAVGAVAGGSISEGTQTPLVHRRAALLLFGVWSAGIVVFAGLVGWRHVRLVRRLRGATPVEEGPLRVELERLAVRVSERSPPELLLSDAVTSPFFFGLLRPKIVLPAFLTRELDPQSLCHVLAHELSHWKRFDQFVVCGQLLAQALCWFHPFLWYAGLRLRHERECACDEDAVRHTECSPKAYGESLLSVLLSARGRSPAVASFLGVFEVHTQLQNRLEDIMNPRFERKWTNWLAVVAFAAVVLPMGTAATVAEESAKLDDAQQAFSDWTEQKFRGDLDGSKVVALSQQQRQRHERELLRRLRQPGTSEYVRAINVLGALQSKKAVQPLLKIAVDRREKDNRDRWMATRALGLIGDKAVVPELIHLVYHYNLNTRFWAQISLVRLTGQNFGRDWQAWGRWWNEQDGKPVFSTEPVEWMTSEDPEMRKWTDPKHQEVADQEFLARLKSPPGDQSQSPKIVTTVPKIGQKDVDPKTKEIVVVFDQDMAGGFSWTGGGPEMPESPKGKKPFWRDKRTCVLPVRLRPGSYYRVGINSTSFKNFRSENGQPVNPTAVYFSTVGATADKTDKLKKPQVVSMEPPNGAENVDPSLKAIRITFDVAMGGGFSWTGGGKQFPTVSKKPHWTADKKTCVLPVELKPNWSYRLGLNSPSHKNFSSAGGVALEPVSYSFSTGPEK